MENTLLEKVIVSAKEMRDKNLTEVKTESNSGSSSQLVEVTTQSTTNSISKAGGNVTSSQNTADMPDISDINESNILGFLTEFREEFKKLLSTLTNEELACLFNTFGFVAIFFSFTSIVTILFGEFLISKLQLETRFPKLAKYLKFRRNLGKYSLFFNIVVIYMVIIIFIYIDISTILS